MKIKVGKYLNWYGPYQIAELILFWKDKEKDESVHNFGAFLADRVPFFTDICQWIYSKRKRKVKIKIHEYDSWNAFHSIALVAHPILVQLREKKHGSGFINDEDVPEEFRSTSAPPKENEWDTDANVHKRYEWTLDEIIWSLGECVKDNSLELFHSEDGVFNRDGYDKHEARKQKGLELFGKYFCTLWD